MNIKKLQQLKRFAWLHWMSLLFRIMDKNYHLQTLLKCENLKFHVFIMQNVTQIN